MVYIKNWKTKTDDELDELWPYNHDGKHYVILTEDGYISYYWDAEFL